jgi:hypothetical protein
VLVPKDIEGVKVRLGTPEQQIPELRLTFGIETYNLAVENAPTTPQISGKAFAQTWEGLECVSVAGYKPHAVLVRMKQRPESVPLDLEEPIGVREGLRAAAEGYGLEPRKGH